METISFIRSCVFKTVSSISTSEDLGEKKPIDNIVYKSFVSKFNEEYSGKLLESQKDLLVRYISSFSDNGVEMKTYLNEEIGRLKEKVKNHSNSFEDSDLNEKLDQVHDLLEDCKDREIDVEMLETVLKTQDLIKEIESDDFKD